MSITALEVVPYSGEDADMRRTPRVRLVLDMAEADADALAAARLARLPSDLLAADAKPTAQAVADALIAAGYGS
tara:strand:+ start:798 stop:1019 length:222 start_codon:yes stop_codon:yes gene_type:complete